MVKDAIIYALKHINRSTRRKFVTSTVAALAYVIYVGLTGMTFIKVLLFPIFSYASAVYSMPIIGKMAVYYNRKKYEEGFP